jgi:hypothetical protein
MATSKYSLRDVVYSLWKARQGVLEAICIKKIIPVCNVDAGGFFLYKDTNNEIWNEDELIIKDDAVAIAEDVCNRKIAAINNVLSQLDCD